MTSGCLWAKSETQHNLAEVRFAPEAAVPAMSVFGTIETCLPARQMSAYDFIVESNPVRVIDLTVDALDLAEMRFEGWSRRRLVGHRSAPRLSSFRNFLAQGFLCCEGHDE